MAVIDLILNFAALLLWIGWRDMGATEPVSLQSHPLMYTLRRTESSGSQRWPLLGWLGGLLVARAFFYRHVGIDWTGKVDLGAISVAFRNDHIGRMLLFSLISFGVVLVYWYSCLLLLSVTNRTGLQADQTQRFIRRALGPVERSPWGVKLLLPLAAGTLLWLPLGWFLSWSELLPHLNSFRQLLEQSLIIGLGTYLPWKLVVIGVMLLYILNSYVYLGNHSFWSWIGLTARRMLFPVAWFRTGKIDIAPVIAIVLAVGLEYLLLVGIKGQYGLIWLYERTMRN